jgi:hypothetical protein
MRTAFLVLGFGFLVGCGDSGSTTRDGIMYNNQFICIQNCCTNQNRVVPCPPKMVAVSAYTIGHDDGMSEEESRFNALMEKELEAERSKLATEAH